MTLQEQKARDMLAIIVERSAYRLSVNEPEPDVRTIAQQLRHVADLALLELEERKS